jgi:xanthosine utilization system XapX-like protein
MMPKDRTGRPAAISKTGYDAFVDIFKKFKKLSLLSIGAGTAVPFVGYLAKINPPWPPGITLVTALVELVALILVFQFLRTAGRKTINRVLAISAPILIVFSVLYLITFALFTYEIPAAQLRSVKGFVCRSDIPHVAAIECPFVSVLHLKNAEYAAEEIWFEWSIALTRVAIATIWLGAFLTLATLIGAFLVFQTRVIDN